MVCLVQSAGSKFYKRSCSLLSKYLPGIEIHLSRTQPLTTQIPDIKKMLSFSGVTVFAVIGAAVVLSASVQGDCVTPYKDCGEGHHHE